MGIELTVYYDGNCPFCAAEMNRLRSWNSAGKLVFVDIAEPEFDPGTLGVAMADLDRELHSRASDGTVLTGIDSMQRAYTLVGRAWMVLPLRVTMLRPLLSYLYLGFARNRYRFSRLMGYAPVRRCDANVCRPGNPFLHRH
jgi:predicted DCC family thiol-disulfide oxidoreductase YuxK